MLLEFVKSAVKGWVGDLSFIGDAVDNFSKSSQLKDVEAEEKHYFALLIYQLQKENISAAYWNQLMRAGK